MVLDREIQLSAETIRAELSDTSALVRDLAKEAAEDAAAAAAGGAAYDDDELDLFDGPPDPSIVPQAALGLFRLTGPVLKRARVGENSELAGANPVGEAARAPAARGAAADGDGDEEEEGEGTQDELPRRRSSRFAEPEAPADGAFEFDGPMAFDEPPPPADDEPPPPFEADPAGPEVVGFAARHRDAPDDLGAGARSPAAAERRRALRRNACFQGCQRVCQREKRVAN